MSESKTDEDDGTFEEIDFDDIEEETSKGSKGPDDFSGILADFFVNINYKLIFVIFVLYLALNSDLFVDKVLSKIEGAVEHGAPSTKGTFALGILLVLFYVVFDLLIRTKLI